ncbi:MAG: hypothetical protein PHD00_09675 [Bacteroidales bacterium]|jgi:ABC-type uncharacterized transport system permease subunit|nr:hypothetical protein [Bacteroidales bacterium]MDD4671801.1 hypothetical protein [Bacteroidales bacterium]MDY0347339.1 hypothetical protein [Tenuifilaceae bacterium]
MNALPKILEIIWVILGLACLALGINATIKFGIENSYMFYILSVVAFGMFLLRRFRRKSSSNKNN